MCLYFLAICSPVVSTKCLFASSCEFTNHIHDRFRTYTLRVYVDSNGVCLEYIPLEVWTGSERESIQRDVDRDSCLVTSCSCELYFVLNPIGPKARAWVLRRLRPLHPDYTKHDSSQRQMKQVQWISQWHVRTRNSC